MPSALVIVLVVQVWRMVMVVCHRVVTMSMSVLADDGWRVRVQVMAVVVSVRVFVFEHFVPMRVLVSFG